MKFLLDTSILIDYIKGDEKVSKIVSGLEGILTSSLCSYEVLVGSPRAKKSEIERLLIEMVPLPFTFRDARRASNLCEILTRQGKMINVMDILIFAQAMERGLGIMTKDNDFLIINDVLKCNVEIIKL